eukprot:c900_g1_i1.p1 GENE.c900_g1_i1~~c900_g1_i1.p1  ORF type:complete len:581 (-),score=105.94 c900_g1_i1:102-1655(-)
MTISDKLGVFDTVSVPSPLFNRNIGKQHFSSIVGPMVYTRNFKMCNLPAQELRAFAQGKIVLIDRYDGQFWDMNVGRNHAECLAAAGALAAIKAYHIIKAPGMGARVRTEPTLDPEGSIPLVHIRFELIPPEIVERIRLGDDTIIANVTADPNEWEVMWESTTFFVFWRIVLPVLNMIGVLLGLTAVGTLAMHMHHTNQQKIKLSALKRNMRNSNMRLLMFSNVMLSCTCAMRLYYCLSGPLYSSTNHSMDFHLTMLDITIVWESTASIAAIMIFHFWSSFGMPKGERKLHAVLGALAVIAFPLYLSLTIIYLIRATRVAIVTLVIKPALLATIAGIVALVYMYRVVQFLSLTFSTTSRANRQHRLHIALFMSIACVSSAVAFVAVVVALLTSTGLTVTGRFTAYTVLFFGLTMQAISQVIAFFPSVNIMSNRGRVVHEQCALVQELRRKRRYGGKGQKEGSEVRPDISELEQVDLEGGREMVKEESFFVVPADQPSALPTFQPMAPPSRTDSSTWS